MRVRVRYRLQGGHYWCRVFVGPDAEHFALAGELTVREEEFAGLQANFTTNVDWIEDEA